MTKLKTILLKIFILPYLILLVHFTFNFQEIRLDGLDAEVWKFVSHGEATEYSSKFSHKKFASITYDMTEQQVIDLLGKPLNVWTATVAPDNSTGEFVVLSFSMPIDGKSYRQRFVYLKNGKVFDTRAGMYYD